MFFRDLYGNEEQISNDLLLLKRHYSEGIKMPSSVRIKRAMKDLARKTEKQFKKYHDLESRWKILYMEFQARKKLFSMTQRDNDRNNLQETISKLIKAPDTFISLRFEADLERLNLEFDNPNTNSEMMITRLDELRLKYEDTDAEVRSLTVIYEAANNLNAIELKSVVEHAIRSKFAGDSKMIEFRRNLNARMDIVFSGRFIKHEGEEIVFPQDLLGHQYLTVFWSIDQPHLKEFFEKIQLFQDKYDGYLKVISFNVDHLPDAGKSVLDQHQLNWPAMHLPNGRESLTYRAYATEDGIANYVNAYGHTIVKPGHPTLDAQKGFRGETVSQSYFLDDARVSHQRYLSHMRFLFSGEFLVFGSLETEHSSLPPDIFEAVVVDHNHSEGNSLRTPSTVHSVNHATLHLGDLQSGLDELQSSFTPIPHRLRESDQASIDRYKRINHLSLELIRKHPKHPLLWTIRNRRMIALMALRYLTFKPSFLDEAVSEAEHVLKLNLPQGSRAVAEFCKATKKIRHEGYRSTDVISDMIGSSGNISASLPNLASASILALKLNERSIYVDLREQFLNHPQSGHSRFWDISSFYRDKYHQFHVCSPNYLKRERFPRGTVINHREEVLNEPFPRISLNDLGGNTITFPIKDHDKLTLLAFLDLPSGNSSNYPISYDKNGKPTTNDPIRYTVNTTQTIEDEHIHDGIDRYLVFLSDDKEKVRSLMNQNNWRGKALITPKKFQNSIVRQLGIFSADHSPNIFLLRRDGSMAWRISGYRFKVDFVYGILLGLKVHTERCEINFAYDCLKKGAFSLSARVFSGPFKPFYPDRYGWRGPRYHGLALAEMAQGNWEQALEAIDTAMDAHKGRHHFSGRRRKHPRDWREDAKSIVMEKNCDILNLLIRTRSEILKRQGSEEAGAWSQKIIHEPILDSDSLYWRFHQKLKQVSIPSTSSGD